MAINIIAYPPGGGGNHLKNLVELGGAFDHQWPWPWVREQRVGLAPYDDPPGVPGEVHSLPGRNIHEVFMDYVDQHPDRDYLLHGHFGELAPYADRVQQWPTTRWLVVTMDDPLDRDLLRARQRRLDYHPYWLDEEQVFLYRPAMYHRYFGAEVHNITLLSIQKIWHSDILASGLIDSLETAFGQSIDIPTAQVLHDKWHRFNFGSL